MNQPVPAPKISVPTSIASLRSPEDQAVIACYLIDSAIDPPHQFLDVDFNLLEPQIADCETLCLCQRLQLAKRLIFQIEQAIGLTSQLPS